MTCRSKSPSSCGISFRDSRRTAGGCSTRTATRSRWSRGGRKAEGPRARGGPAWGPGSTSVLYTNEHAGQEPYALEGTLLARAGRVLGAAPAAHLRARCRRRRGRLAGRNGDRVRRGGRDASISRSCPSTRRPGASTGPAGNLTSGNNHVGFFDPAPDGKRGGLRRGAWRLVASLAHRSAGAPGRADAGSELLGRESRVVARRRRDRVFPNGRGSAAGLARPSGS